MSFVPTFRFERHLFALFKFAQSLENRIQSGIRGNACPMHLGPLCPSTPCTLLDWPFPSRRSRDTLQPWPPSSTSSTAPAAGDIGLRLGTSTPCFPAHCSPATFRHCCSSHSARSFYTARAGRCVGCTRLGGGACVKTPERV